MHWFWKVLIAIASLVVLGLVGLAIVIYIALPSPAQLRESMLKKAVATAHKPAPKATPCATCAPQASSPPAPEADAVARAKVEENERLLNALLDKSKPLSTACESLRTIKYPQTGKLDPHEFGKSFKQMLEGEHSDPQIESLMPILKFTLTQPVMLDVFDRVRTAKPQSMMEEFKSKKDFYFLIAKAYEEMKANRAAMEGIVDDSYLTMMLGRAVEAKPELASDPATADFCRGIEGGINEDIPVDFAANKVAFEKYLTDHSVDPKSIGYNPNYRTNLQIVFNEHGLHFTGGWIDDVFAQLVPKK